MQGWPKTLLPLSCFLLLSCSQSTKISNLEPNAAGWDAGLDDVCDLSTVSRQQSTTISGEFSLDAEGEFPTLLIIGEKRYLAIFKQDFYQPSAVVQNLDDLSSARHRNNIQGVVYDGKAICKNFGPYDGAIFVLNAGKPVAL